MPVRNKSGISEITSQNGTIGVVKNGRARDLSVKVIGGVDPYVIFRQGENEIDEVRLRKDMSFDLYASLCGPIFSVTPPAFTEAHCNGYDWILWDKQVDKDVLYFFAGETKQWQKETIDINAVLGGRINQIFPHRANFVVCPEFKRTVTDYDFINYAPTVTFKRVIEGKPSGYKSICAGDYTGDGYTLAYLSWDDFLKQDICGIMTVGEDDLKVRKLVPYLGNRRKAHTEDMRVNAMKDIVYVSQYDGNNELREWYLTNDGNLTLKKWGSGAQDTCERMITGRKFSHLIESAADRMVVAYEGVGVDKGKHFVEAYVKNPTKEIEPENKREYALPVYLYTGIDAYTVSYNKKTEIYTNGDVLTASRSTAAAPLCGLCASWYVDGHMITYIGGIGVNITEMHSAVMGYLNDELRPYQKRSTNEVLLKLTGDAHMTNVAGVAYSLWQNGEEKYTGYTDANGNAVLADVANGVYEQQLDVRGEIKNFGSLTVMGDTLQTVQVTISVKWDEITGKPDFDSKYAAKVHTHTKDQVGLDKVDNTSDKDKPISTLTQTALDKKSDKIPSFSFGAAGSGADVIIPEEAIDAEGYTVCKFPYTWFTSNVVGRDSSGFFFNFSSPATVVDGQYMGGYELYSDSCANWYGGVNETLSYMLSGAGAQLTYDAAGKQNCPVQYMMGCTLAGVSTKAYVKILVRSVKDNKTYNRKITFTAESNVNSANALFVKEDSIIFAANVWSSITMLPVAWGTNNSSTPYRISDTPGTDKKLTEYIKFGATYRVDTLTTLGARQLGSSPHLSQVATNAVNQTCICISQQLQRYSQTLDFGDGKQYDIIIDGSIELDDLDKLKTSGAIVGGMTVNIDGKTTLYNVPDYKVKDLKAGTNVTLSYDAATGTYTVNASSGSLQDHDHSAAGKGGNIPITSVTGLQTALDKKQSVGTMIDAVAAGCDPTGATDISDKLNAIIAANTTGKPIYFAFGVYKISKNIVFTKDLIIAGEYYDEKMQSKLIFDAGIKFENTSGALKTITMANMHVTALNLGSVIANDSLTNITAEQCYLMNPAIFNCNVLRLTNSVIDSTSTFNSGYIDEVHSKRKLTCKGECHITDCHLYDQGGTGAIFFTGTDKANIEKSQFFNSSFVGGISSDTETVTIKMFGCIGNRDLSKVIANPANGFTKIESWQPLTL